MVKRKKKRIFKLRYLIILLFGLYLSSVFISQHKMISKLNKEKALKNQEITKLKEENQRIQGEIEDSDSLETIERIAREELNMVKPEETVYIDKEKSKDIFREDRTQE